MPHLMEWQLFYPTEWPMVHEERPICFASHALTAAERKYSQLDKEALAIVFGVKKHHQYLYGRRLS